MLFVLYALIIANDRSPAQYCEAINALEHSEQVVLGSAFSLGDGYLVIVEVKKKASNDAERSYQCSRYISSTEMSAGLTPLMRDACPRVRGFTLFSFC